MFTNIKRIVLVLSGIAIVNVSYADDLNNSLQDVPDGTNLTQTQSTNLDNPFVSSKKMFSLNDSKAVLQMLNLNLVVNGQSNTQIPDIGLIIKSNGNVRDYLNRLGNQFGYTWALSGSNVVFTPIVPKVIVVPTPTPQPKPVIQATPVAKPAVNVTSLIVASESQPTNKVASNPVVSTPTSPVIKTSISMPNKEEGQWKMDVADGTVKKTLQKWAKQAGWQIIWSANVDFPIQASMVVDGQFDYAVNEVCRASQFTGIQLLGEFHPKNKVVVISSPNQ